MQVGLHSEMRVIQTNGKLKKHGFLLSGSFPHNVFVSVTVIALPISLCCQSFIGIPKTLIYSITLLTYTVLGNTNLKLKLIGF